MKRPALRWHGGKFILAKWIISHFPEHRIYVEPFGGAASVLFQKPRAYAEVYNDINDDLYCFFKALRETPEALKKAVENTPYSRREFEACRTGHPDPVERARRLLVRSFMGFGADSASNDAHASGFRTSIHREGSISSHDWAKYPENIPALADRLKGVVIECRDAMEVMKANDSAETLHYVDPPYTHETRKRVGAYTYELNPNDHTELLKSLNGLKGSIVLSGYENLEYDVLLGGWEKVSKKSFDDSRKSRTEVLWIKKAGKEK